MCLRVSPVVIYTGVCLVIWDDMLGTQNLPKQKQWCNSVWSVRGASRHHSPEMSDPVLLCLQDRGSAEVFSLDDVMISLVLLFWVRFIFLILHSSYSSHDKSMVSLLMLSKWDEREEGVRSQEGECEWESDTKRACHTCLRMKY